MSRFSSLALCGFLAMFGAGCMDSGASLAKPTEKVSWPALDALQSPDNMQNVIRPAQMGDIAGHQKYVSDPKFADLLAKFESEEIPAKFKTPAREEAKAKLVSAWKALIAGAKSSASREQTLANLKNLTDASSEIYKVEGN